MLFIKLMKRCVPKCIITLLYEWYHKLFSCVKWNNTFSEYFAIVSGVRQGSVLSPFLYAIFVDEILNKLEATKKDVI